MNYLDAKVRRVFITLLNLPRALKLIWAAGKGWVITQIFLLVIRGILPATLVYLTKLFVDALLLVINGSQDPSSIYRVIWIGTLFGIALLASELLAGTIQMIYAAHAEKLSDLIFTLLHEKSISADLAYYEQPEFFDHLHRARDQANYRPAELTGQLGSLLQNSITLISMGVLLFRYGPWLPIVLLLSTLPTFYVVLASTSRMHSWQRRNTAVKRRANYYDWLLTSGESAAELRIFELGGYFKQTFGRIRAQLRKDQLALSVRQKLLELSASLAALIISAVVFVWVVRRTLRGVGTLGDLVLFYQVFSQGQSLVRSFLGDIGRLYGNSLFLGDLFEYLDLEPEVVTPTNPVSVPQPLQKGISFENVTFQYRNSNKVTLRNFNLFIPSQKIVAIVGANGAGKTTLIKLLCRFYDPVGGQIRFDGTDLRDFSVEELRRLITILFQAPVRYNTSARDNIALGNLAIMDEREKIESAAQSAGADEIIKRFPKRYDQMLGHLFADGIELSAGEWQRLALARAIFRKTPLILLDEPTSAMDPWAETDWLKRFLKQAQGTTVVIITHRFTTAMRADLIYVMQDGEIVEAGSHDELLSSNGRYASSWQEQVRDLSRAEKKG
jgi:ATP-binding cassette subfamily B protein